MGEVHFVNHFKSMLPVLGSVLLLLSACALHVNSPSPSPAGKTVKLVIPYKPGG